MAFYRGTYYSPSVMMDHEVNILIPDDIKPGEKLQTLYLLHGYMGNHHQWMRYTSLERYTFTRRLCIVMPEAQNSYYTDHAYGYKHFQALNDLKTHVESLFPVSKERKDTFVAGLSMGGYGALKWALTYPEFFQKAASLSGALDIFEMKKRFERDGRKDLAYGILGDEDLSTSKNNIFHLIDQLVSNDKKLPELFIACGKQDFLYKENVRFINHLKSNHIMHVYMESDGIHEWKFWDTYIQEVLKWI